MSPIGGEVTGGAGQSSQCTEGPVQEFEGVHRGDGFFPVKKIRVSPLPTCGGLSRGTRQRIGRRRQVQQRVNETISALNHMVHVSPKAHGCGEFGEALSSKLVALHSVNKPEEGLPKPQEALRELLGSAASAYAGRKCAVKPYVEEQVSWPAECFQPVSIERLLDTEVSEEICGLHSPFVEKPASVRARRRETPAPRCYQDPAFRDRRTYVKFVKQLEARGLLRFGTSSRERITVFLWKRRATD